MDKYEVTILSRWNHNRWSMMLTADDFAHAEEQAKDADLQDDDEIISITKDYDAS